MTVGNLHIYHYYCCYIVYVRLAIVIIFNGIKAMYHKRAHKLYYDDDGDGRRNNELCMLASHLTYSKSDY